MASGYPNGGYRNRTAAQLSMGQQATPPTVTANRGSVSGNRVIAPQSGWRGGVPNPPSLNPNTGRGTINIQLPANENFRSLGSRLRSSHTVQINLRGPINAPDLRARVMKEAFRVARGILKLGKVTLGKTAYTALAVMIAEQIIANLQQALQTTEKGIGITWPMYGNRPEAGVWAIDHRLARFIAPARIEIASVDQTSIRQTGGPPGLGEYISTSVSTLPTASNARIQEWMNGGKNPYDTVKDEYAISAQPWVVPSPALLYYNRNVVIGRDLPGVLNSQHVATFRVGRGVIPVVEPYARVAFQLALRPNLYPPPVLSIGGQPNARPALDVDFRKPANDKKFGMSAAQQKIAANAWAATELGDLIDSIFEALPIRRQYGRSYLDKMKQIWKFWHEINWAAALGNIVYNHYEDKVVGNIQRRIGNALRKISPNGFTYQYGVTQGGGSSVYTGNISF